MSAAELAALRAEVERLTHERDFDKQARTIAEAEVERLTAALNGFLALEVRTYSEVGEWQDAWDAAIKRARAVLTHTEGTEK